MIETNQQNEHRALSKWVLVCGLLYIFAYQFRFPFKADLFLYGMVLGLAAMAFLEGRVAMSQPFVWFLLTAVSAFIGVTYTTNSTGGIREAILFTFFAGVFALSWNNTSFIQLFAKWIYIASVIVVVSSIVHFLIPSLFNAWMRQVMRANAYTQLMWSFDVDHTFAGLAGYTPNTTFSAAVVFGNSFLNLTNHSDAPVIKSKLWNIILLVLSVFSIILCSKRGIFVATVVAWVILMFYLYRGKGFFFKFLGIGVLLVAVLAVLYQTSEFVSAFLDRFTGDDVMSGRDDIYEDLITAFKEGNTLVGNGTAATYELAEEGAHNIYIQILYDHGILFSVPYYVLLLYNYYLSFKNKCPISIFVQTMFLVYGLSGNPLYSNMFMIIYIYHVLYAAKMPEILVQGAENETASDAKNHLPG